MPFVVSLPGTSAPVLDGVRKEQKIRFVDDLAPDITRAALEGRLPVSDGVSKLLAYPAVSWDVQRQRLGPSV